MPRPVSTDPPAPTCSASKVLRLPPDPPSPDLSRPELYRTYSAPREKLESTHGAGSLYFRESGGLPNTGFFVAGSPSTAPPPRAPPHHLLCGALAPSVLPAFALVALAPPPRRQGLPADHRLQPPTAPEYRTANRLHPGSLGPLLTETTDDDSWRRRRLRRGLRYIDSRLVLTVSMDLAPFKLDIDELLDDYANEHCTSFTDFKRVWMAKKFSYIYEGRPKTNSGVFMQSLFLHCIGHMTSQSSLSQRLAGLYCLYCLYECQPYKPHFKIYLSLEESKQLKEFVVEAKQSGIGLVPALVKSMLDRGMFLFGFINLLGDHGAKQVDELNAFQTKRVKFACDKLFANTQIGRYTHTDLGEELELDTIKKLSMDYAKAKELAFAEASQTVDVEDAKHILQNDKLLGDRVEEIVKEWDAQKEEFYQKTGVSPGDELAVVNNDESGEFHDENDGHAELAVIDNDKSGEFHNENEGFDELEQLLLE